MAYKNKFYPSKISRRAFLRMMGIGTALLAKTYITSGCSPITAISIRSTDTILPIAAKKPSSTYTPSPTATQTSTATLIPTATPTNTPTPTELPLIDQWSVVEGKLMKRTQLGLVESALPEGVIEPSFVEMHKDDLYVIDKDGYAEAILKNRKWKKYIRPIKTVIEQEQIPEDLALTIVKEMPQEQINRLTFSDGSNFPYGYLFDIQATPDSKNVFFSGYPVGGFYTNDGLELNNVLFEMPMRYGTQRILIGITAQMLFGYFSNYWKMDGNNIEQYGQIDDLLGKKITYDQLFAWCKFDQVGNHFKEMGEYLISGDAKNRQMIIALQQVTSGINEPYYVDGERGDRELVAALKSGDVWEGYNCMQMYINSVIVP